jgi:hypothetical protein
VATEGAYVTKPEDLLRQVLDSIRENTYSDMLKGIQIDRLINYIKHFYEKYKRIPNQTHNLEVAKAFSNLIYLIDPDFKNERFDNLVNAVTHSWLEYIPKSIKAARPIKTIPGEVIEKLAIPIAKPAGSPEEIIELPAHTTAPSQSINPEEEFNVNELKKAKYGYNIAEFCFVLREYEITDKFLKNVLRTQYLNVDAQNLIIQNYILWSEEKMEQDRFEEAIEILNNIKIVGMDSNTVELITDKLKETTVLEKITQLEEKCPLNERSVGLYLRKKIGYKKFLKLTYYIFGNIEFHQRLEEIRIYPKKMIYPLLSRDPTPKNEELIVKHHEIHDQLIRELYDWFWELEPVKYYLSEDIKDEVTLKFGEFGSGPVIYFRYISKGQYANIMISKAIALVGQGDIQRAKRELFQTYELTGSKKIKAYLDLLREQEKSKKSVKNKRRKRVKKKIKVVKK